MTRCIPGTSERFHTGRITHHRYRSAAPVKIKHIQGTTDTNIDGMGLDSAEAEAADRALSSVSRKLDTSMSVEYTVNDLIAAAVDPANLSQIFAGKYCSVQHQDHRIHTNGLGALPRLESSRLSVLCYFPCCSCLLFFVVFSFLRF
jgi:hypothetical protein